MIWADRRFKLGHGRAFALYVAAYCLGRGWIEYMRVDEAHHILGVRLNVWTAVIVFVLAVVYLVLSQKLRPGREEVVEPDRGPAAGGDAAAGAEDVVADAGDAGPKEPGAEATGDEAGDDGAGAPAASAGEKAQAPQESQDAGATAKSAPDPAPGTAPGAKKL